MSLTLADLRGRKGALVIAHPGHELRVHHWLEATQPSVFVLTDGSGRTERSRLDSTLAVLARAGARPAGVFGRFTDAEVYELLERTDAGPFTRLLDELVDELLLLSVDYVVADALEGFNPSHDICRYMVNVAVALVEQRQGRQVTNYDFLLDGTPEGCPPALRDAAVEVKLDADALDRKLLAADGYPELASEVRSAIERFGRQAFSAESLRPVVDRRQGLDGMPEGPPYYETFGEQQVRAGHYRTVIRYRDNVHPVAHALWDQPALEPQVGDAT